MILKSISGKILKDPGEGKSSQWAEFQIIHLVMHFFLEGEINGQMCD